jgi:hypothetical protein
MAEKSRQERRSEDRQAKKALGKAFKSESAAQDDLLSHSQIEMLHLNRVMTLSLIHLLEARGILTRDEFNAHCSMQIQVENKVRELKTSKLTPREQQGVFVAWCEERGWEPAINMEELAKQGGTDGQSM